METHTFRVRSPLPLLIPAILACIAALVLVFLVMEEEDRWILLVLGSVMLFSLTVCLWLLTRTRLEISAQGITYYAIGYSVHSAWDNLTGWGRRVQGALELDCLLLREPGMEMAGWLRLGYRLLPFMNAASLVGSGSYQPDYRSLYHSVIPVGMFDRDWRTGEIGRLVNHFAPQVFAEDQE
jgi:drug/metabolite transporter superfamily protein YnfA